MNEAERKSLIERVELILSEPQTHGINPESEFGRAMFEELERFLKYLKKRK